MGKRWVWAIAIGLVLLGGAWNSAVGGASLDLTKLKSLCVDTEELPPTATQDHNLSKEAIKNYVYVWLKGKLPRLRVERFRGAHKGLCSPGKPYLYVNVNIRTSKANGMRIGFYGNVHVYITRLTTWETGNVSLGIAYFSNTILIGPMGKARSLVNDAFELLLTDFAAEYYKAGNP